MSLILIRKCYVVSLGHSCSPVLHIISEIDDNFRELIEVINNNSFTFGRQEYIIENRVRFIP
jgi:hypothetical protein